MSNMIFENMAASILQRLDREADIDETVQSGPYYFNENYGKQQTLHEMYESDMMTNQDDLQDDEGKLLATHVEVAAKQIIDGYKLNKDKVNPEKLVYITDEDLLNAISRKTTEVHAILKSGYGKEIAKEHIEQAIRRQIKYMAYSA